MKQNPASQSGIFNPRVLVAFTLCFAGVLLAVLMPGNARGGDTRGPAISQVPNSTYVTDGTVNAVVRSGDTIYIGGLFDRVGPRTGPGLEFAFDGSQNPGLPEVSGGTDTVNAVASDGAGGWYIGGLFTHVGGVARKNIAHIRADRSVDPAFDPNADDAIHALVVSVDGLTVYAGGLFTLIGGQTRNRIAALNAANGTATAFNPNAVGLRVEALAISGSGSIIYAGGDFTSIGGQSRNRIAALNAADGTATLTFNPNASGTVRALAILGSTLYVGGTFATIGGQPRSSIAALTLGGALDGTPTSFNPNASYFGCSPCANVYAIAVSSSTVYAGGTFDTIGGQPRRALAGLDPTSGAATAFNPDCNGSIAGLAMSVDDLTVYAAGSFSTIGGQPRNNIAGLNTADGTATALNPLKPNSTAQAIAVSASAVYVGGFFTSIGGVVRHSIAALNATDGTATSFDPNPSYSPNSRATINAFAVSADGSTVYVGGFFTVAGGQPRNYIAALNAADGTATSWNPGANTIVKTLALSGPLLYVGGNFTSIGGQPRNFVAALNTADGTATAFNPSANAQVEALAVSGPLVYAGGHFSIIGGQSRRVIAALNTADGTATAWNPDPQQLVPPGNPDVFAVAVSDSGSTIYAGGYFTSVQGLNRRNIAAVSAADGSPTAFDPQASGTVFSDAVHAIALSDSKVYAAGRFQTIGGQTRNLLAELNPSDGTATSFDPGAGGGVGAFALAVASDGTLYVGGSFKTFELASQQGFAAFSNASPTLTGIVSRKTHGTAGTFDVDLPITGNPGIECRSGAVAGAHQMIFTFATPVTVDGASVTTGTGSATFSVSGAVVTVDLTGVTNAQTITVTLINVSDGVNTGNVAVSMGVLSGDTNGSGSVSASDVAQTKAQSGNAAGAGNFRTDVNSSGSVSAADVALVKSRAGTVLPP